MTTTAQDPATCPACIASAAEVHYEFRMGCLGCAARAVSRGPNWRRCRDAGRQDSRYQGELRQLGVTHEQVKAAAAADQLGKGRR